MAPKLVAMNEPVRPQTLALDSLVEETVAKAQIAAPSEPADNMLFLGNRHHAFPTAMIKDPVLEPVDKLVWMVIILGVQETGGNTAFPSYGAIGRMANILSRATISRAIAILRVTRWLTLCRRVRTPSGRFCGNVYALHDEPLPLADACHLDADYLTFLKQAAEHTHQRVRAVAEGVLRSMQEESGQGHNALDSEHPIERRLQSVVDPAPGGRRRFFAFTGHAVRQLRKDLVTTQQTRETTVDHDQILNTVEGDHDQNLNTVCCSSSYINKKTTTKTAVSKFDLADEDGRPLVYPRRLGDSHREIANRHLESLAPAQRQPVLDELEGRFQAEQKGMKPVYDEIRFLSSLCKLATQGKFQPNLGLKVRAYRAEREALRKRARQATEATKLRARDDQREERLAVGQASLSSIRNVLGLPQRQESALGSNASETSTE